MAKRFAKLTSADVKRLGSRQKITEHGITFERLDDRDGRYSVNIMVDGTRIHRVIGLESEGTTRTQAEEFISKVRQDARTGRLNLPKGRKLHLSFSEAADQYLDKLEAEGGKDIKMKKARLAHHLNPFFGNTPLSRISSFDVERYKKHRLEEIAVRGGANRKRAKDETETGGEKKPSKHTSPGTVNRELAALSHLFNKATEWGWIDRRPAFVRRLKEDRGRITYLTTDQAAALLEAAEHDASSQIHCFIKIGLDTAMRRMEILSIRREHVDLQRRMIFIPKAKAGSREQPMTGALADYLRGYIKALPADAQWLFPSPGSALGHTRDVRRAFVRVVKAAGLNPREIVRHTLRHTAITHLVQAGVDLPTVKRISGHKTLVMVERYAHANGEHIGAAMDRLEARYASGPNEAGALAGSSSLNRDRSKIAA